MSRGKRTQFAPSVVPSNTPGRPWKPSLQPSSVSRIDIVVNGPFPTTGGGLDVISPTPSSTWVGQLLSLPNYGMFTIESVVTNPPSPYNRVYCDQSLGTVQLFDNAPAQVLTFNSGFKFDEVSYWTCALCGPDVAWRKKDLRRHEVTGQFVCPADYDKLSVTQLEAENGRRAEAVKHLADDYTFKSEWP